eukprot:10149429-Lingulodinium_polyedra.AAC.1
MKCAKKGKMWTDAIQHTKKASQEMKREKEKDNATPASANKKKSEFISLSKEMLAKTFLECLQEGGLIECMAVAGRRMDQQELESREYSHIFADFMEDPWNEEKKKVVEEVVARLAAHSDYLTFKEICDEQPEYLLGG